MQPPEPARGGAAGDRSVAPTREMGAYLSLLRLPLA